MANGKAPEHGWKCGKGEGPMPAMPTAQQPEPPHSPWAKLMPLARKGPEGENAFFQLCKSLRVGQLCVPSGSAYEDDDAHGDDDDDDDNDDDGDG